MVKDEDGNNVIHYAVICQSCLGSLLNAIEFNNVSCDLNDVNNGEPYNQLYGEGKWSLFGYTTALTAVFDEFFSAISEHYPDQ